MTVQVQSKQIITTSFPPAETESQANLESVGFGLAVRM